MMTNTSHKNKLLLLGLGLLVLAYVSYSFSIKKTVNLVGEYKSLSAKLESSKTAQSKVRYLKQELNKLEQLIGKGDVDANMIQGLVLSKVNKYCGDHETTLVEVYPVHQYSENDYVITTNSFKVSGDFLSLLRLNELIENDFVEAKVSAVHYETKENIRTKRKKLYATFYIQNISKI